MENNIEMKLMPEEILSKLVSRTEFYEIIINQPQWLIEGIFLWCNAEGNVRLIIEDNYQPQNGMPLIMPGKKYAISLSSFSWSVLQSAILIIIDSILSDPFDWKKGAALASANTVFAFVNNLKKITKQEYEVMFQIMKIKKEQLKGIKRGPSFEELVFSTSMSRKKLQKLLDGLVDKKLIHFDINGYKIVW